MKNILFVITLGVLLVMSITRAMSIDPLFNAKAEASSLPVNALVTVEKGESIWTIASRYKEASMSTNEMVNKIIKENNLTNTIIHPGENLIVPLGKEMDDVRK